MIVATPSPLTQLLSNGEDLMGNINQLIARFSNLLSEENTARISRTLDHLDQATGALSAERENVSAVMQQLAQASRQANAALAQASELMRSANGLLNEQGKGMLENANKTMASLERTSATLDQLISENRHSLDGGIRDSPSWARRSANCAIPWRHCAESAGAWKRTRRTTCWAGKTKEFTP